MSLRNWLKNAAARNVRVKGFTGIVEVELPLGLVVSRSVTITQDDLTAALAKIVQKLPDLMKVAAAAVTVVQARENLEKEMMNLLGEAFANIGKEAPATTEQPATATPDSPDGEVKPATDIVLEQHDYTPPPK